MEKIMLGQSDITSSRLAYGCMRLVGEGEDTAVGKAALDAAFESGYTLFDHADIYGDGRCESLFGEWLRDGSAQRDRITIVSKCGIRLDEPKRYDFSSAHLIASVDGSVRQLGVEHLDMLLLHRPDYLMRLEEVAGAFDTLRSSGKVAEFGVSNFSVEKLRALQSVLPMRLQVNQVEINIEVIDAFEDGVLDQCQSEKMTPQAWSPLAGIAWDSGNQRLSQEQSIRIRDEAERQAKSYRVERWQIALAWLLRHPAGISPIIGSTTPGRIRDATDTLGIDYSREDWYRLLEARNGPVP